MVVMRRPTCKPGEPIFDYPSRNRSSSKIPGNHDPVGPFAEPPFKGEWTTHISYLNR
jgi:hypothetical protein